MKDKRQKATSNKTSLAGTMAHQLNKTYSGIT
jgi:hypothetical protein